MLFKQYDPETPQPVDFSWSDTMWLGRLGHKNVMHFHLVFLECSTLELSHHDVRKSKKPMERPHEEESRSLAKSLGWAPVNRFQWVNHPEDGSSRPHACCLVWHWMEKKWALPTESCPNNRVVNKINDCYCFKPLWFGVICYIMIDTWYIIWYPKMSDVITKT